MNPNYTSCTIAGVDATAFLLKSSLPPSSSLPIPSTQYSIQLNWLAVLENTDGSTITTPVTYNVYRSSACTVCPCSTMSMTKLQTGVSIVAYNDLTVVNGNGYSYTVSATASNVEGGQSVAACAVAAPPLSNFTPQAPGGLTLKPSAVAPTAAAPPTHP
jgi:hypothetical protein